MAAHPYINRFSDRDPLWIFNKRYLTKDCWHATMNSVALPLVCSVLMTYYGSRRGGRLISLLSV